MKTTLHQRPVLALIGGAAGASLYALGELLEGDLLGDRLALALAVFAVAFFFGLLGMTGPLPPGRAAALAAGVGLAASALLSLAGLRFDKVDDLGNSPFPFSAGFILMTVPLPFLIAASGPGWRDYASLFSQAWGIFVRYSVAWVFVGVVWGVILLSDALFGVVGLTIIEDVLQIDIVPWLITGTVLGLALAVVQEMADVVSPYLVLRLLRLLVPVVLVVLLVFIAALPLHGLSGLFGGLSVAATLLAMTGAAATLITSAVDQDDLSATENTLMQRATQGLALVLPVPAVLAGVAIWMRVAEYGWTPDRLFAASAAVLSVGYGVLYAVAVLRGRVWKSGIRQGNTAMALVLVGFAALWLTPVLNPEGISARSQVARVADGRTAPASVDLYQIDRWGRAGEKARASLTTLAAQPGFEDLGQALANPNPPYDVPVAEDLGPMRDALIAVLPLQPPGATATRDQLLRAASSWDLQDWTRNCTAQLPQGGAGCVMVVADLLPTQPGEEALLVLVDVEGAYVRFEGLALRDGYVQRYAVWSTDGQDLPGVDEAAAIIKALQAAPPPLSAAPLNQLALPGGGGVALTP
jgi:hypothetical protein